MKTLIVAFGGNALIKKGQKGTAEEQLENLKKPLGSIADLLKNHKLIITHGNGPQVGNILLQQTSNTEVPQMPLDICVAQSQGQIGYMIEHALDQVLTDRGIGDDHLFLTVLSYVHVSSTDPAFQNPSKPIGPAYPENKSKEFGYPMKKTAKGWRRVVPSPLPEKIYQRREIKKLLEDNFIIITCGGGGIPVTKENGKIKGIEAVIDKDLASAKLGEHVKANILLMVTDVEGAAINFGKDNQKFLKEIKLVDLKKYQSEGQFADGSMGPKVQAAINFLESGGEKAIICNINKIGEATLGTSGTQITK
jgi:carbamate kinase|tara:strand:+ start:195 stop:1115 length:921 start_codon:yes stop_codon:yes gene_type:complete